MKIFVLALALFAPDGSKSDVPVELWHFASLGQCEKSAKLMNSGKTASRTYRCIESDPSPKLAANAASKTTVR